MNAPRKQVAVSGAFDDLKSKDIRFLQEAAKLGDLTVMLWSDEAVQKITSRPVKFPLAERSYLLNAIRFVSRVVPHAPASWSEIESAMKNRALDIWITSDRAYGTSTALFCEKHGIDYRVLDSDELGGFPEIIPGTSTLGGKKVIVTGCYDWFHSGHVRFFEEAAGYGDLYVVVGHDANIRLLKGEGRPLIPQDERRYITGSVRFVKQSLVSTGNGWLDAEPEMQIIQPDIYLVNEDGDVPEKRDYCAKHGLEYVVLKRKPAPGLPKRSSTDLRGF